MSKPLVVENAGIDPAALVVVNALRDPEAAVGVDIHCHRRVDQRRLGENLDLKVVIGEGEADGWTRWASGLKTYLETGETKRFFEAGAMS